MTYLAVHIAKALQVNSCHLFEGDGEELPKDLYLRQLENTMFSFVAL
jgi:hypothetical protein